MGGKLAAGQPETVLIGIGSVAIVAAIVGGALTGAGVQIPVINSPARQALLGGVGIMLLTIGLAPGLGQLIFWYRGKKLAEAYTDLLLKTNDLFFTPGGIRDLLAAFRTSRSQGDWMRVMDRAELNETKLAELRSAKDALRALGRDPDV